MTGSLEGTGTLTLTGGELDLKGQSSVIVDLSSEAAVTLTGDATDGLTVAGITGGNASDGTASILGGKITINDTTAADPSTKHSYAGNLGADLALTVTKGEQEFEQTGTMASVTVGTDGKLTLADKTTVSGTLDVDGTLSWTG